MNLIRVIGELTEETVITLFTGTVKKKKKKRCNDSPIRKILNLDWYGNRTNSKKLTKITKGFTDTFVDSGKCRPGTGGTFEGEGDIRWVRVRFTFLNVKRSVRSEKSRINVDVSSFGVTSNT